MKPNVLLICMDDQAHRTLGGLNNPEVQTPNLDRLVRRGLVFTHAVHQGSPWTGAICIPSRAMLLTGMSVFHCRQGIDRAPLLGEVFGAAGYETYFTGKWHNEDVNLRRSYRRIGPQDGGMLHSTPERGDAYRRPAPGNRWDPADRTRGGHWMEIDGRIVHSSERWADAAVDFLRSGAARGATPFFLHVAFHAPHDPRQAPQEFLDLYPPEKIALPPNAWPEHPFDNGDLAGRDEQLAPFPRTPEAVRLHRREYYAILTHADAQIGRILEALEASGATERTLVCFTADHGLAVGEHGLLGKQSLYEHSVRVPLILAGPGVPHGARRDALVYQHSLFPTLCDLTGVPKPPTIEHESLAPLVRGRRRRGQEALFGVYQTWQRAVRTARWKLIVYPQVHRIQLFDLIDDPWERRNRAGEPGQRRRIAALFARLQALQAQLDDPLDLGKVAAYAPAPEGKA